MARKRLRFGSEVSKWAKDLEDKYPKVVRRAVQLLAEGMQDEMPEVSGNLKRSVVITTGAPVPIDEEEIEYTQQDYEAAVRSIMMGDTAVISVRAAYALLDNFGYTGSDMKNRPGKHWYIAAVNRWPACVEQAKREFDW